MENLKKLSEQEILEILSKLEDWNSYRVVGKTLSVLDEKDFKKTNKLNWIDKGLVQSKKLVEKLWDQTQSVSF